MRPAASAQRKLKREAQFDARRPQLEARQLERTQAKARRAHEFYPLVWLPQLHRACDGCGCVVRRVPDHGSIVALRVWLLVHLQV